MSGMIDFHSHILPGIDDGSQSLETSIAMLKQAAEQGVTHMVATPHFYPQYDTPDHFLEKRAEAEAALRAEMARHTGLPELTVGAEVYYYPGIGTSESIKRLTIGGSDYLLVEMPGSHWTNAMYQDLEDLFYKQSLVPVVAHLDRYIRPLRTYGIPGRLEKMPVLIQLNAEAFLNRFTAPMALRLLKNETVHLLGSDCHNLTTRQQNLGAAAEVIEKKLGQDGLSVIESFGQKILSYCK